MNQELKDQVAKALGIPKETQQILDAGSSHSYYCKCHTCALYWKAIGPDYEDGSYGPFTKAEIDAIVLEGPAG